MGYFTLFTNWWASAGSGLWVKKSDEVAEAICLAALKSMRIIPTNTWAYDSDDEDWKVGDFIIWEEEKNSFPTPFQITFVDWSHVCWKEDGKEVQTRPTNMLRVKALEK